MKLFVGQRSFKNLEFQYFLIFEQWFILSRQLNFDPLFDFWSLRKSVIRNFIEEIVSLENYHLIWSYQHKTHLMAFVIISLRFIILFSGVSLFRDIMMWLW